MNEVHMGSKLRKIHNSFWHMTDFSLPSDLQVHVTTCQIIRSLVKQIQSNLSKWILLKWITHLNECHLSGPI